MRRLSQLVQSLCKKMTLASSDEQRAVLLHQLENIHEPSILSFINAHAFNLACKDNDFAQCLLQSTYLLRDGVGMALLLRGLGIDPGQNLNGTDLIPKIVNKQKGRRLALFGTNAEAVTNVAMLLQRQGQRVVVFDDGFQDDACYIKQVLCYEPDLILLGMGMPKQERVAALIQSKVDYPCLIVNGGAIIDFMSGNVKRAPKWVRRLHLEWCHRLFQEPKRLWRRYVLGNALFLVRLLYLRLGRLSKQV